MRMRDMVMSFLVVFNLFLLLFVLPNAKKDGKRKEKQKRGEQARPSLVEYFDGEEVLSAFFYEGSG